MTTTPTARTPSIDEYINTSEWDGYELDDGVPVEVAMSTLSAWVGGRIYRKLDEAADRTGGVAFPADTALQVWPLRPGHFRKPDAMYFTPGQLPAEKPFPNPLDVPPAIAVEVISPNEPGPRIEAKTREYLAAGVRLVWVVYPETRSIHIYRPGGSAAYLGPEDTLTGEDVLPGFAVRVADLLPAVPVNE
jgi:Uma2 family endonuclease